MYNLLLLLHHISFTNLSVFIICLFFLVSHHLKSNCYFTCIQYIKSVLTTQGKGMKTHNTFFNYIGTKILLVLSPWQVVSNAGQVNILKTVMECFCFNLSLWIAGQVKMLIMFVPYWLKLAYHNHKVLFKDKFHKFSDACELFHVRWVCISSRGCLSVIFPIPGHIFNLVLV